MDRIIRLVERERIGKDPKIMLYAEQIRAARAILNWRQEDLAQRSGIGHATVRRIESQTGMAMGNVSTLMRLKQTLGAEGIEFIGPDDSGWIGVRIKLS